MQILRQGFGQGWCFKVVVFKAWQLAWQVAEWANCGTYYGYEKYVGNRTDIRVGNELHLGSWFVTSPDEVEIRHIVGGGEWNHAKEWITQPSKHPHKQYFLSKHFGAVLCDGILYEKRKSSALKRHCDKNSWECYCSVGYQSIWAMLKICSRINVFGLTVPCDSGKRFFQNEYYNPAKLSGQANVRFAQQGKWFKRLVEENNLPLAYGRSNRTKLCRKVDIADRTNRCDLEYNSHAYLRTAKTRQPRVCHACHFNDPGKHDNITT